MADATEIASWVSVIKPVSHAKARLFCLPYAGGGSRIFRTLPYGLPETVEVCSINLPGREGRMKEPPFTRLSPLVEVIAEALGPYLNKPFALFGHSMGAVLSFELARRLRGDHGLEPQRLFVSGRRAPQIPEKNSSTYDLPAPEFVDMLRRLNGTPKEALENPELLQLVIPLLRADFELVQTYEYKEEAPLACPITAFGGLKDVEVSREDLLAWRSQTTGRFNLAMFPGDHFFLHTDQPLIAHVITRDLRRFIN